MKFICGELDAQLGKHCTIPGTTSTIPGDLIEDFPPEDRLQRMAHPRACTIAVNAKAVRKRPASTMEPSLSAAGAPRREFEPMAPSSSNEPKAKRPHACPERVAAAKAAPTPADAPTATARVDQQLELPVIAPVMAPVVSPVVAHVDMAPRTEQAGQGAKRTHKETLTLAKARALTLSRGLGLHFVNAPGDPVSPDHFGALGCAKCRKAPTGCGTCRRAFGWVKLPDGKWAA